MRNNIACVRCILQATGRTEARTEARTETQTTNPRAGNCTSGTCRPVTMVRGGATRAYPRPNTAGNILPAGTLVWVRLDEWAPGVSYTKQAIVLSGCDQYHQIIVRCVNGPKIRVKKWKLTEVQGVTEDPM
jgi:hypothetical protein